jgi:glycosyltransferase involved in cell wall biosynthesis
MTTQHTDQQPQDAQDLEGSNNGQQPDDVQDGQGIEDAQDQGSVSDAEGAWGQDAEAEAEAEEAGEDAAGANQALDDRWALMDQARSGARAGASGERAGQVQGAAGGQDADGAQDASEAQDTDGTQDASETQGAQDIEWVTEGPQVSIVVPVYNAAENFYACINSIVNQTYTNLDIVLVDDGSTDESGAMCDEVAAVDRRVRVFHRTNAGPSRSRNFGIDQAQGTYLMFVDSDDVIGREAVQRLEAVAETCNLDLVFCGYKRFGRGRNKPRSMGSMSGSLMLEQRQLGMLYLSTTTNMWGVSIWAKLYRLSVVRDNGVRFLEDVNYEEDCRFNLAYFPHVRAAAMIPNVLYFYRQQVESLSKGYRPDAWEQLLEGYRARIAYLEPMGIPNYRRKLGDTLLTVYESTVNKIAQSGMSDAEKKACYQRVIDTPEVQELQELGVKTSRHFKNDLLAAAAKHDADAVARAVATRQRRRELIKHPLVKRLAKIVRR